MSPKNLFPIRSGLIGIAFLCTIILAGCGDKDSSPVNEGEMPATTSENSPFEETTLEPDSSDESPQATSKGDEETGVRLWKNRAGEIVARGELITVQGAKACLQTPEGTGEVIAIASLSSNDRNYVRQHFPEKREGSDLTEAKEKTESHEKKTTVEEPGAAPPLKSPSEVVSETVAGVPEAAGDSGRDPENKVVIPFDFVSEFDQGRYGAMVGDMIWKKLDRKGAFVIPESMQDVRSVCQMVSADPAPERSLEEMEKIVRDHFQGDIGIWGRLERVPGHEWDVYDLSIKCVDFSEEPPRVIYEIENARTETVSEIPHLYVKQMLESLHGVSTHERERLAEEERRWKESPNLVEGGGFQHGANGVPKGWESRGGQLREPLGDLVRWIDDPEDPGNKVLRLQFGPEEGNGYGVMYYSKPFPIEEGAKYRFACRFRTSGPKPIIFIKCYAAMPSRYRPVGEDSSGEETPSAQMRECYRSQQNLYGETNRWHAHRQDFTPRHTRYTPREGRVMLYAYLGGGKVDFDDIVLKQIAPPASMSDGSATKHSMESDVTLEEMRRNEQRMLRSDE